MGSTVILLFPPGRIAWNDDLRAGPRRAHGRADRADPRGWRLTAPAGARGDWRPTATRERLAQRAAMRAAMQRFFAARDVLEVETPAVVRAPVTDLHLHCARVDLGDGLPVLAAYLARICDEATAGRRQRRHLAGLPGGARRRRARPPAQSRVHAGRVVSAGPADGGDGGGDGGVRRCAVRRGRRGRRAASRPSPIATRCDDMPAWTRSTTTTRRCGARPNR